MLLERTFATLQKIGNDRLQLPIFYESPVSLRFETGDPTLEIFLDETHLNPRYLKSAQWRTSFLYEKTAPFDTLLWVLYRTPDLDTDIDAIIEKFCGLAQLPAPAEVYQQEVTTAAEEPMTRILLFWDMKQTPPQIEPLLEGILSSDFKGLGFRELSSAVFFFNTEKHLLFHPYDDRGVDVVAEKTEDIRFLYEDCQNWLLEYDLERMQQTFQK
ncbi:MAG: DUF3885 domain-containing protein [Anaerotignum sp.]